MILYPSSQNLHRASIQANMLTSFTIKVDVSEAAYDSFRAYFPRNVTSYS